MNSAIYKSKTGGSIVTRNHALPYTVYEDVFLGAVSTFLIAIAIVIGFAFIGAFYASFLVSERENSAKHQQLVSGVSITAYWLSTLVWDIFAYQLPYCTLIRSHRI